MRRDLTRDPGSGQAKETEQRGLKSKETRLFDLKREKQGSLGRHTARSISEKPRGEGGTFSHSVTTYAKTCVRKNYKRTTLA